MGVGGGGSCMVLSCWLELKHDYFLLLHGKLGIFFVHHYYLKCTPKHLKWDKAHKPKNFLYAEVIQMSLSNVPCKCLLKNTPTCQESFVHQAKPNQWCFSDISRSATSTLHGSPFQVKVTCQTNAWVDLKGYYSGHICMTIMLLREAFPHLDKPGSLGDDCLQHGSV